MKMNLDCRTCTSNLKKARGCLEATPIAVFDLDGEEYFRCPLRVITRQSAEYIRFFNFFDRHLPNNGAILDQPGKFLDVVMVIEGARGEMEEEGEKRK